MKLEHTRGSATIEDGAFHILYYGYMVYFISCIIVKLMPLYFTKGEVVN